MIWLSNAPLFYHDIFIPLQYCSTFKSNQINFHNILKNNIYSLAQQFKKYEHIIKCPFLFDITGDSIRVGFVLETASKTVGNG